MADMSVRMASLTADKVYLAKAGGLLLVVVFGLKSAMVPLHFWLTHTYVAAIAPVAALFAIMTKVGIYSLLRVHTQIFGAATGELAQLATPVLWPLAVVTVIVGAVGVLASKRLKTLTANLVLVSVGSLLMALAMHREEATAAAIYYLVHSTLVTAALFLLADMISVQRGPTTDQLVSGRPLLQTALLGGCILLQRWLSLVCHRSRGLSARCC
jgi:multicomponent K+:H+ antiporter subunit D